MSHSILLDGYGGDAQDVRRLERELEKLKKVIRQYEPPTLPMICEICGKEYDQEVIYFDPNHHPNCDAEDRHAHSRTAADICTVCRLQGAPP